MDSSSMLSKPATQAELNYALINAIHRKDTIDTINQLISAGADVNAEDESGNSALSYAAQTANIDIVNVLLPHIDLNSFNNPEKNSGNFQFKHPLHLAILRGNVEVIVALLPKFNIAAWNIDTPDDFMKTPLINLGEFNHPKIIKVLTTIFSLFDEETLNSLNQDGNTILYHAVNNRQEALASVLIALKADVNKKNNISGDTAMSRALNLGEFNILSMLIKAGGNVTTLVQNNHSSLSKYDTNTHFLLLSALPKESIFLQKQSWLRHIAINCINEVNKIRDTIFHTLFALQTRKKTSLPNDPAILVLSYLEQPKWYDHRFSADIQAMLKRVGMVLRRREEAAKQARVTNSTATRLPSNALALLTVPTQTLTFSPVISSDLEKRGMKRARSTQSTPVTIAPVENIATSAASGHRYPKRTRSFTGNYPK